MKILFVADGQNPHAHVWFQNALAEGHEVHVVSTYPITAEELKVKSVHFLPFDFSAKARAEEKKAMYHGQQKKSRLSKLRGSKLWSMLVQLRNRMAPFYAKRQAPKLRAIIEQIQPDVVQGLRIPFEGICAALAVEPLKTPLILSTWGNDFTLFAEGDPMVMALTKRALLRADALQSDCEKDIKIARSLGLKAASPAFVIPGNLGLDLTQFGPHAADRDFLAELGVPKDATVVLNPRGSRAYVRNDLFFEAIPQVLKEFPDVWFAAIAMKDVATFEEMVVNLNIQHRTVLLPPLNRSGMAKVLACAEIAVSLGEHDGTPNSLIECMASGAYPIALDIPSLQEIVTTGENGTLVAKSDVGDVAKAIIAALKDDNARTRAKAENNIRMQRLSKPQVRGTIADLYQSAIKK